MSKYTPQEEAQMQEHLEVLAFLETAGEITQVTETPQGDVIIPVKAIVFAQTPTEADLHGDRFDKEVDFGHPATIAVIPAYFDHGKDKSYIALELVASGYTIKEALLVADEISMGKEQIGLALRSNRDKEAVYYNIVINRRQRYKAMLKKLAEDGDIGPSTGVKYRENDPADPHLIKTWHPAEITLTPTHAEPRAVVVKPMDKEIEMPEVTTLEAPPAASPPVVPVVPVVEKPINPLVSEIEKAFAPPVPEVPAITLEALSARMGNIEKMLGTLVTQTAAIESVDKNVLLLQEAMPILVQHVAKALAPGMVKLMDEERRKTAAELDVEKSAPRAGMPPPALPSSLHKFPATAPGGK